MPTYVCTTRPHLLDERSAPRSRGSSPAPTRPAARSPPRYAGTVGVPAVFGPAAFPALLALDPAAGAKRLLGGDDVVPVDLPAAAVDVDTPADYRRACGDDRLAI